MRKIVSIYILVGLFVLAFSSCKKGIETVEYESSVYLPNYGLSTNTLPLGESNFELGIYRSGINSGQGSVTVNVIVDSAAFDDFKTSNPNYRLLPDEYYTLETPSVTIAEGDERAMIKIHMKKIDESFVNKNYILPISIESVSPNVTLLEDQTTAFLGFSNYRNIYESKYYAYGTILSSTGDSVTIDSEIIPASINANTIEIAGPEDNMKVNLTVKGNEVTITNGTGSSSLHVRNTTGRNSTYSGEYNEEYQCNEGTFHLYYTYVTEDMNESGATIIVTKNVSVELKFWL